jgi:hypothetical protein
MSGASSLRRAGGHAIAGLGLLTGLGGGVAAGVLLPAMPWIALPVAIALVTTLGGAGLVCAGDVFTASCPCCSARAVTTTWRQTFQCRRCRTLCALAALRRPYLRSLPPTSPRA